MLHLPETIENCGPRLNLNQFWMERFGGYSKHRLNAKTLTAESLTENEMFAESVKMFYHSNSKTTENHERINGEQISVQMYGLKFLPPSTKESMTDIFHTRMKTNKLLK